MISNSCRHFDPIKTYQYSDAMLKHLPEKALKKTMLYNNKAVSYNKTTITRRTYNSTVPADRPWRQN